MAAWAQEAASGVDLRATLTGQAVSSNALTEKPRSGSPVIAGFHGVLYPTLKFNDHWFATAAWQLTTHPYFFEDLSSEGYGAKGSLLHATLGYTRVSDRRSVLVRAGEMLTSFGSFPLRYDDADNPLMDMPSGYGYYYAPVSMTAVAGAQADVTSGKWDARVQFANSSPSNPRSIFARDQYGNWAGGGGYTVRQGLRTGVSAYRGPYLDRQSLFFIPGESKSSTLKAHAVGVDLNWAHAHTNAQGEVQRFIFPYDAIPTFREWAGYGEVKQVLSPRWFVAGRFGLTSAKITGTTTKVEGAAGYRAGRTQLIKAGYEWKHFTTGSNPDEHIVAIQWVTTLHTSAALRFFGGQNSTR
jgi:hypothetical protein